MHIPPASIASLQPWTDSASSASYDIHILKGGSKGRLTPEKWSTLIGIVTAICGNILISFALNTQRYAHMRLSRDREEWELKRRRERRRNRNGNGNANGYGTQQAEIADERASANRQSHQTGQKYTLEEPEETDPLIPSVDSLVSRKSTGSTEDGGPGLGDDDKPVEKSYLRSPIWWLGISMMTVGEAGNFLAYGFAPASIVSPLGVVALISNCLIAPFLLRERFRWRDGLGVVIAVTGCVTIVLSASTSNPKLNPDRIWHLITAWEFETYLAVTIVLILALMWASNKFGDKSILIDLGLMGLFGGYTALSTKGVASLLSSSVWKVVTFPITYLLVAILVGTAVMQIKYVNRALQRFNSTMVIPTQFVLFTISVIVGSAILYRDFERTSTEDAVKFLGGCALTFLGVWFITSGRGEDSSVEDEAEDEDDTVDLIDEEGIQPEIRERDDNGDRKPSLLPSKGTTTPPSGIDTPTVDKPSALSPAKAAAIHEQSAASLHPNGRNGAAVPPPMHATTSTPEVPTTNNLATSLPRTPRRTTGNAGTSSSTTNTPSKPPPGTPATPTTTPRHPPPGPDSYNSNYFGNLNRHSVAGLLPGPITSPLSSSLSAIVADTLRHHSPGSSLRRPSFRRQRNSRLNPNAVPQKRHSIASGEMDFGPSPLTPETPTPLETPLGPDEIGGRGTDGVGMGLGGDHTRGHPSGGRVRSLSATLHDIFGSSTRKARSAPVSDGATPAIPAREGEEGGGGNGGEEQ